MFYFGISDRFLGRLTVTTQPTVSQPHTRKSFFGRLAMLGVFASFVPRIWVQNASAPARPSAARTSFRLRPETRAVARDESPV